MHRLVLTLMAGLIASPALAQQAYDVDPEILHPYALGDLLPGYRGGYRRLADDFGDPTELDEAPTDGEAFTDVDEELDRLYGLPLEECFNTLLTGLARIVRGRANFTIRQKTEVRSNVISWLAQDSVATAVTGVFYINCKQTIVPPW